MILNVNQALLIVDVYPVVLVIAALLLLSGCTCIPVAVATVPPELSCMPIMGGR